jgi:hypothetical protein
VRIADKATVSKNKKSQTGAMNVTLFGRLNDISSNRLRSQTETYNLK